MADGIRWVGLDVHAHESTIAIFDQATGELTTRRVVGRPHVLMPWLRGVARPARMVYEAGPTGYGLARRALAEGIDLCVCAPGRSDRDPTDRVKTDKRDSRRLAGLQLHRAYLAGDQRRTRPLVVGILAEQMPAEHGELACHGDRCDLVTTSGPDT